MHVALPGAPLTARQDELTKLWQVQGLEKTKGGAGALDGVTSWGDIDFLWPRVTDHLSFVECNELRACAGKPFKDLLLATHLVLDWRYVDPPLRVPVSFRNGSRVESVTVLFSSFASHRSSYPNTQ